MIANFQKLSGKNLFITGGSGFVGKSLLDCLNSMQQPPRVLINSRSDLKFDLNQWKHLDIAHVRGDIADLDVGAFNHKVDYIIHAATSTNTNESQDLDYLHKTIYIGTQKVLKLCRELRPLSILYISSGAVYGLQRFEQEKIEETDSGAPSTLDWLQGYGHFKRLAETLCSQFHADTKIPVGIARCFAFSGTHLDLNGPFALTNFLKSALAGKNIEINSTGEATRSYMDQRDMSEWLLNFLVLNNDIDILNVGSDQGIKIIELAHLVAKKCHGIEVKSKPIQRDDIRSNFYVPSIQKARSKYQMELRHSLSDSLDEMISAFKNE